MPRFARLGWTFVFLFLPLQSSFADSILELNPSFIKKYKNKLTISVHYTVDAAHRSTIRQLKMATCMSPVGRRKSV